MNDVRQYAYIHFLAAGLAQTSIVAKASRLADDSLAAFDKKFETEEDRSLVSRLSQAHQEIGGLRADLEQMSGDLANSNATIESLSTQLAQANHDLEAIRLAAASSVPADEQGSAADVAADLETPAVGRKAGRR